MIKKITPTAVKKDVPIEKVGVHIKISKELKAWIEHKGYSQTKIFTEACKIVGYKGN